MNTREARERLVELAHETLEIVERRAASLPLGADEKARMREILREARVVGYDAGYPGDLAWHAILHTSVHVNAPPDEADTANWPDTAQELREGLERLSLVTDGSF